MPSPARLLPLFTLLCSALSAVADDTPRVLRDIAYAPDAHRLQTYDLHLPTPAPDGRPAPLVVWIHGGAWKVGDKNWNNVKYLVAHGYALASIDYRLSGDAPFPAQIRDCNLALDHLLTHAPTHGIDPARVFLGGASAGGHLALLLGLARDRADFGADPDFHPLAILDFFGPADLTDVAAEIRDPHMRAEIGGAVKALLGGSDRHELARLASPIHHVAGARCPVLIFHGADDDVVPLSQSQKLESALRAAGAPVKLVVVPATGHDGPNFETPPMQRLVLDFLAEVERAPTR
ncbi:MAG: alpha/beta hydrolase [Verrucomicrobiota bacterium]